MGVNDPRLTLRSVRHYAIPMRITDLPSRIYTPFGAISPDMKTGESMAGRTPGYSDLRVRAIGLGLLLLAAAALAHLRGVAVEAISTSFAWRFILAAIGFLGGTCGSAMLLLGAKLKA